MWDHAEVAGRLDQQGRVRVVSRNESEAPVRNVMGRRVIEMLVPESHQPFLQAFGEALHGGEAEVLLAGVADAGYLVWGRVRLMPSPEAGSPVLFHMRRLPKQWQQLSPREREVIQALNDLGMNAKRAARQLGISVHTLNAHRRSICRKCDLNGVGDFWIFVQRCR